MAHHCPIGAGDVAYLDAGYFSVAAGSFLDFSMFVYPLVYFYYVYRRGNRIQEETDAKPPSPCGDFQAEIQAIYWLNNAD